MRIVDRMNSNPIKRFLVVAFVSAAVLALLASCREQGVPTVNPIRDTADLLHALREAGVEVERVQAEPLIPSIAGETWAIDRELIQIGDLLQGEEASQLRVLKAWVASGAQGESMAWIGSGWYAAYAGYDGGHILLLSGLLGDPLRATAVTFNEPFPPAVPYALRTFADAYDREPQEVAVLDYQSVIWPDACLGLEQPGRACEQVETPGWLIRTALDGEVYDLHSDETGAEVIWQESDSP